MIINGSFVDIALIEQDSNTTQEISGISPNLLFQRTNASLTVLLSTGVSLTIEAKNVCYFINLYYNTSSNTYYKYMFCGYL